MVGFHWEIHENFIARDFLWDFYRAKIPIALAIRSLDLSARLIP